MTPTIIPARDLKWSNFFCLGGGNSVYRVTAEITGGSVMAEMVCRHDNDAVRITLEPGNPVVRLSRTEALETHGQHPQWQGGR
jgi:hypothetical protein